ncbi:MAG: cobalamin biosynthesis protein [Methanimicrococcus sp.]|nr:cobalamin biosynthesis protein [Methanimicrococcus sp.]
MVIEWAQILSNIMNYNPFDLILILEIAVLLDIIFGEPPAAIHPVVWIGKLIAFLKEKAPAAHRKIYGTFMALIVIGFSISIAAIVLIIAHASFMPYIVGILIQAVFLKATFAIKCMVQPAKKIQKMMMNDIETVRDELKTYVSRDTSQLTKPQIYSAVVESVSENYVDAILSPIFFFIVFGPFGLIAAYFFKAASTLDSMIGYKTEKYINLGWFSAKVDDVLNWIPARISPIIFFIGAAVSNLFVGNMEKYNPAAGWKLAMAENKATSSPNSGWPMAAAAGTLSVRLEKPDTYVIGNQYKDPESIDITRASMLIMVSSLLTATIGCIFIGGIGYLIKGYLITFL